MEPTNDDSKLQNLLSQADELISQLNSGLIDHMEEGQRARLERYANEIQKRKLEVKAKTEKEKDRPSDYGSSSEGMHQAIDEIVKALKNLVSDLT